MSNTVISVENLGKKYNLTHQRNEPYTALRDVITEKIKAVGRGVLRTLTTRQLPVMDPSQEEFWALKDVSFEIKQGESVGIIGRNGAGKSTLLKVISRITEPTSGRVSIKGRVASLLEVGTGFHPELTGRENIFMNGAILGMTRAEIIKKFDEIVAFSEIEKFLDTPVKRYSSGMYVRLAFAVAAHLEPEILIIDEVLAVGDAAFQKKCLGKMGDVAKEGRTVLFVSHNMVAIQSLCDRAIWLNNGKIMEQGIADDIVSKYLQTSLSTLTKQVWDDIDMAPGNDKLRIHSLCVRPDNGSQNDLITMQTAFVIEIKFWNLIPGVHLDITLHVYNEQGIVAFATNTSQEPVWHNRPLPKGIFQSVCHVPANLLNSGMYRVKILFVKDRSSVIYQHEDALSFNVKDSIESRGNWYGKRTGVFRPELKWATECVDRRSHIITLKDNKH